MLRQIITGIAGIWLASSGQVTAQSAPGTVVELYTSQGCSSCPPADEYLGVLAAEPGVIALALHVDYWDYIGWTDQFASPKFTARQKAYAKAGGSNTIYTPQMIVAGVDRIEGSNPEKVEGAIRNQQAGDSSITLYLTRDGGKVTISATSNPPLTVPVHVQLVRYRPTETVSIKYGENAGRVIKYNNIVTSWSRIGEWSGKEDLAMTSDVEGNDPVVVILQTEGPGMILAASVLK
ncbi:MAG: DUF1223 domain-containing protein [Paracoccaceae bacterium]